MVASAAAVAAATAAISVCGCWWLCFCVLF